MTSHDDHIVAVDSMILVWGIRKVGDADKIKHAGWLFDIFEENGTQIIVPSVSLAEYLIAFDPSTHNDVIAPLAKRCILAPFDAHCAALAARLFVQGKEDREMDCENARNLLKSDCLIIATAVVHGARTFYSDDARCRNLAKRVHRLKVEGLPTIAPDLFLDAESERATRLSDPNMLAKSIVDKATNEDSSEDEAPKSQE